MTVIKQIIGLDKKKFYIFRVPENTDKQEISRLRRELASSDLSGMIIDHDVKITIPEEETQNEN